MGNFQKYFWACIFDDGSMLSEHNADGTTNVYTDITEEQRKKTVYFGLASATGSYFFDLNTGEYHYRDPKRDVKSQIRLPVAFNTVPLLVTGPLPGNQRCNFYQWKKGHTDFDMSFQSSGNIIDGHVIGYNMTRYVGGRDYFVDVQLQIDPDIVPVKAVLDVTLKGSEKGPTVGSYTFKV